MATSLSPELHQKLSETARALRMLSLQMITEAQSGHPGGSLSAADLVTVLFFHYMTHNPHEPHWPERDRFVLSKGHGVPVVYAALAKCGYFPEEELMTLRKINSRLQGHPDHVRLPFMETSSGSLGQGLSIAQGMAMAAKLDQKKYKTYCLLGDGETQEGQIWEAAMSAPKYQLDNLIAILDFNKGQIDGYTEDVMNLSPLKAKWEAFNWEVQEIDGHDLHQIFAALNHAQISRKKPHMIIAHTIKGKGVSFMEDNIDWHGKSPSLKERDQAIEELRRH
ncbi:MAG: transketolase [Deltaproteobacteria bacterium]|nr:transketolase [Deltaproteobacteria bacterium]